MLNFTKIGCYSSSNAEQNRHCESRSRDEAICPHRQGVIKRGFRMSPRFTETDCFVGPISCGHHNPVDCLLAMTVLHFCRIISILTICY